MGTKSWADTVGRSWDYNGKIKSAWFCKSCTRADGSKFVNGAAASRCTRCKLHKGVSFGGAVPPACPSTKVPPKGLPGHSEARQLQLQAVEIAKLKKQLQQASATPTLGPMKNADEMNLDSGDDPKA